MPPLQRIRWTCQSLLRCLPLLALFAILLAACAPAATQSPAPAAEATQVPAAAAPTVTTAAVSPAKPVLTPASPAEATATQAGAAPIATAGPAQVVEGRQVELEWPERLRLGDSDVIRLALVPTKAGYVAKAEFPDHTLQTQEVTVPRPNGYVLYAVARLDGVGFDIAPIGDQERFIPTGEEVAWRWTLSPRQAGRQRLSVLLRLRWVPGPGVAGAPVESQAYARGLDVQVSSFLGMSPGQAASTGFLALILGGGLLLAAVVGVGGRGSARAARSRGGLETVEPAPGLGIEAPAGLGLSPVENDLLRGLFRSYARLVIENEFLSGYSGARTFLVLPIRPDGCADAPTIVKLGPSRDIRLEYENYDRFVKDRLPPMTARIQRPPVIVSGKKQARAERAAVQYTFIAEPGHPPVSLRQALLQDPDPANLLRLFETFGPGWWMQRRPYTFRLAVEYDRLLPPHYVLEPLNGSRLPADLPLLAEMADPGSLRLKPGDAVSLAPFKQMEQRADGQSYSLIGKSFEGRPALRLRWAYPVLPPGAPVAVRVVSTRMNLLREWTAGFDRFGLPDPLDGLPATLDETVAGTRSVIHGDLNLENVLVGPGSLIWLIDFAQTREGHPLFDFAHLASELIAHVLAVRAGSPRAYLDLWRRGDPLLQAVEQIAGRCLFDPARPREYHLALYLACLGALKYQNLSPLAKHCLYLTAAEVVEKVLS